MLMHIASIFAAGFFSVFMMGFQSRNVNAGHYAWAAACSFAIGLSQVLLWRQIARPESGVLEALVYGLAGACAITSAMFLHSRFVRR